MSIVHAFSTGLRRATSEPKMVLVLYFLNLLLAIPLALAFRSVMIAGFGDSLAPAHLMASLDFTVFQDFLNVHGEEFQTVIRQILSFLVLSMLLQTFLSGGILTVVLDQEKTFSTSSFFKGCGSYFFRFLRLFLLFGLILLVVALIVGGIVLAIAGGMTENATSEVTEFWIRIAAIALFMLPVTLILMAADYAKIYIVLHDERSALRSCGRAFGFVFRRFFAAFGLELLMLLISLALFAIYLWLDLAVGMTTGTTIVVMFVIQQLFMLLRAWTKILFFAGEMALYQSLQKLPFPEASSSTTVPEAERIVG